MIVTVKIKCSVYIAFEVHWMTTFLFSENSCCSELTLECGQRLDPSHPNTERIARCVLLPGVAMRIYPETVVATHAETDAKTGGVMKQRLSHSSAADVNSPGTAPTSLPEEASRLAEVLSKPRATAPRGRMAMLHSLQFVKPQLLACGSVCEVRLGNRAFAVCWALTLSVHAGLALFYFYVAYLHQYMKSNSVRYYAEYVSPDLFTYFGTVIVCNGLFAACHMYAIVCALWFSMRYRRLVFGSRYLSKRESASRSGLGWLASWGALVRAPNWATKTLVTSAAGFSVLFGRRGLFGVEGTHFAELFLVRELVEILLQTFQAWKFSMYISMLWVNRAVVAAIVVNCWSTPLIHYLFHDERHESLKKVGCLVLDVLLDILSSAVIPLVIFLPYANAYDTVYGDFPLINYYMDTWYINAVAETRQVFALSWIDVVSKTFPGYTILSSMRTITASFPPPHSRASSKRVGPAPTTSALSDTRASSCPDLNRAAVRDAAREQPDPRRHTLRREVTLAVLKKSAVKMVQPQWHKDGKRIEIVLILWGIGVVIMHLHSLTITRSDSQPGCLLEKRPWMAGRHNCVVMEINCVAAGNVAGHEADVERILESLEPSAVKSLIFSSCPELQMPHMLQRFSSLETIKVHNSTINRWDGDAALTGTTHSRMLFVYMLETNMTAIPDGLLSRDFPPTLADVEVCGSNLTTLPDDLFDYWPNVDYLVLENCPGVQVVPDALRRMRIRHLSLCSNSITALPDYLFDPSQSIQMMELAGNPLSSLPERDESTTTKPTLLNSITLGYTNISQLPLWLSKMSAEPLSYPLLTISAGETPFCREIADAADPETGRLNPFVFVDCTVSDELPIRLLYPAEMEKTWRQQSLLAQTQQR